MKLIEHPEPDFDLESELPAELAAMADQLMADADFLCDRYPAGATQALEPESTPDVATSATRRGARFWWRAAAILLALTGMGTVLNSNQDPASCTVENNALDHVAAVDAPPVVAVLDALASHVAIAKSDDTNTTNAVSRVVSLPDEPGSDLMRPVRAETRLRPFDAFTTAEQEALLDLNTSLQDVSVDF